MRLGETKSVRDETLVLCVQPDEKPISETSFLVHTIAMDASHIFASAFRCAQSFVTAESRT